MHNAESIEHLKSMAKEMRERFEAKSKESVGPETPNEQKVEITRARTGMMLALIVESGMLTGPDDFVFTVIAALRATGMTAVGVPLSYSEMLSAIEAGEREIKTAIMERLFARMVKPQGSA